MRVLPNLTVQIPKESNETLERYGSCNPPVMILVGLIFLLPFLHLAFSTFAD